MAAFVLPRDVDDDNFAIASYLDENFAAIETLLNGNLADANLNAAAAIATSKIGNGGAVGQDEVTTTGEASKIPKLDANACLVVNKIIFKDGV
jgi:hypothetical protein